MGVTLSDKAATHVANFLAKRGKGIGLRLGVRTSGCSGMAYKLEFVDEVNPDDLVFEHNGVKVIVDAKSMPYLEGMELVLASRASSSTPAIRCPQSRRISLRATSKPAST